MITSGCLSGRGTKQWGDREDPGAFTWLTPWEVLLQSLSLLQPEVSSSSKTPPLITENLSRQVIVRLTHMF